jgi:hypothetical protein
MPDNSLTTGTPQFSTAEYAGAGGPDACKSCGQPIGNEYYRVNTALACPACAKKAEAGAPKDTHARFVRGVTFGGVGAILGLALYSVVGIATGLVIGYVALAVGYIVAKAIKMGSNGMGGRRYQIAAALLTYAAVSLSAVPIGIASYVKARSAAPPVAITQPSQNSENGAGAADDQTGSQSLEQAAPSVPPARPRHATSRWVLARRLLVLGLISPLYDLWLDGPTFGPLIGLLILFIGIRIAWQMTAAGPTAAVIGPFKK